MKRLRLIVFFILVMLPAITMGQVYNYYTQYRPGHLNWQQIKTEHFRIIFPDGEDSLAYRSAAILESHYQSSKDFTGGSLHNFPVILNNYNARANGFVSPFNFRTEIDLTALKGKGMNPQTGDWLETVLPHELIHAGNFNVQIPDQDKKFSIPNFLSYFSPDIARTVHSFPQMGMHEGIAVYYETESVAPMGGRGNYTFFNNRFNANFGSAQRWSMGQTLAGSDYSLPYNRHYIAGYTFMNWLQNSYGESITKDAIRFHYHHFFLGYGYTLRIKTGKWPGQLYEQYQQDLRIQEQQRLEQIVHNTTQQSNILDTPLDGEEIRVPKWISNSKLLFYGSFYNGKVGFYSYDLPSDRFDLVKEIYAVGDFNYEINGSNLLFARFKRNSRLSGVYETEILDFDLEEGVSEVVANQNFVYGPASNGETTLAIQAPGPTGNIVEVMPDGSLRPIKSFSEAIPVRLQFNPINPNQLAVILNRRGVQALWITSLSSLQTDLDQQPTLAFKDGSMHDIEWHPGGQKLLFTMDAAPAMNVYEYELSAQKVTQITSSMYNAFEASYAPDGNSIAYILQIADEHKLAILSREDFLNEPVSESVFLTGDALKNKLNRPFIGNELLPEIETIPKTSYHKDLSWLKPRMIYPVLNEHGDYYESGAGISSIDALSQQAYSAEITSSQDKLWYDIIYTNKQFYPGLELSLYNEPEFFSVLNPMSGRPFTLIQQNRGLSFSVPFEYTFRGDTRLTSLNVEPEFSADQFKYYDQQPEALSDFTTIYKASVFSQLNIGILTQYRDLQPSSGFSLFGLYESSLNEPEYSVNYPWRSVAYEDALQWTAHYGIFGFLSPLRRFNQSLRIDLQFLQQSKNPIYSNDTITPLGYSDTPFPNEINGEGFRNIGRFSTRYTIPLFYPDNGGVTVPLYLSSIYLTTFTHTLTDMNANDLHASSRSIFGGGFHVQFKVSNLLFDLGVGIAYEPTRNNTQFIFGQF